MRLKFLIQKLFKNEEILVLFILLNICLLPLSLILGSAIINGSLILLSFSIFFIFIKKKIIFDQFAKLLLIFSLLLIVLFFFSIDQNNSFGRTFAFMRFIMFAYAVKFIFEYKDSKFKKLIFYSWSIILIIIALDLIFEFVTGKNTLGFGGYMGGRLSGFLNTELKMGFVILSFSFLISSFYFEIFKKKIFSILIIIFLLYISFIIGERANFIRFFLCYLLFIFFLPEINKKIKILSIAIIIILPAIILISNEKYNKRYGQQFLTIIKSQGLSGYLKSSQYGAHYKTAYEIFKNYPLYGIGIKNFSKECKNEEYFNKQYVFTSIRCSTHPHQFHLEILSSLGLPFYLFFLSFFLYFIYTKIRLFIKTQNIYLLSSTIFLLVFLFTPLPTGSFFTTFSATMFWMNFGISNSRIKVNS
jgi:O-antigen ligase